MNAQRASCISGIGSIESQLHTWKEFLPNIVIPQLGVPPKPKSAVILIDWEALGNDFPCAVIRILNALRFRKSPQIDAWGNEPDILTVDKILPPSEYLTKKRNEWEGIVSKGKHGDDVKIRVASLECSKSEMEETKHCYPANILDFLEILFANPRLRLREEIVLHGSEYHLGMDTETKWVFSMSQTQSGTFFLGEYRRGRVPYGVGFLNLLKRIL